MKTEKILREIRDFSKARDWEQFHNPKDLSVALSIEAAELMELFLWKNSCEVKEVSQAKRDEIENEIADIATYLLRLCDVMEIDLEAAIRRKLALNAERYPIENARGKNLKYTDLKD